ncbi:EH signature domain-containing protein [Marinobacter segnicrescens]|nr:EH signature domain-containing protein [Marinobacter segnicrescens]
MEWPDLVESDWATLIAKTETFAQSMGGGSAFDSMCERITKAIRRGDFNDIYDVLEKRIGGRALTWLWCNDSEIRQLSCRASVLRTLVDLQKPRLTRTTFLQLCRLYFQEFDQLESLEEGLFGNLESVLGNQSQKMPRYKNVQVSKDPIVSIQENIDWILGINGPARLSQLARDNGEELEQKFSVLGLVGYDDGRYGDLCRAHYYLETLKDIEVGHWDPIFDELLKPSVNRAPFGDGKRIGHVALEVIIDRAGREVSEDWQDFVLGIAGDPRIKSSAASYQEWWKPLGNARVEKVRGWLSREDLKLFLQALEQYGIESRKADLQRMFPARRRFLEGLYNQNLIRNTRLMLGRAAEEVVKRLLGDDIKTNFATLDGVLSDKAIIYVDCGDFYLVEGSHNFKIWVYLAPPGKIVPSYDFSSFTHGELTHLTPAQYRAMYDLPLEAVTHNRSWQSKVINFLSEHGIELDIESLLSPEDYRGHLSIYGYPVVETPKARVPEPKELPGHLNVLAPSQVQKRSPPTFEELFAERSPANAVDRFLRGRPSVPHSERRSTSRHREPSPPHSNGLSDQHKTVLGYLAHNPNVKARHVAALLGFPLKEIVAMFAGPLAPYVERKDMHTWVIKSEFINKFK